jgi:hypothetical protein
MKHHAKRHCNRAMAPRRSLVAEKSGDEYWHKGKGDGEWKAGLPPAMKPQDVARAFRSG